MSANIEVKARLRNPAAAHATAARLSGVPPETLDQKDVFFPVAHGRLKLRFIGVSRGELIWYKRADSPQARRSDYQIAYTAHPEALRLVLAGALGTLLTVKKTRVLYRVGNTRIHIDQVEGLGDFLEFEVVLGSDSEEAAAFQTANSLMKEFTVQPEDLVGVAYFDLLAVRT